MVLHLACASRRLQRRHSAIQMPQPSTFAAVPNADAALLTTQTTQPLRRLRKIHFSAISPRLAIAVPAPTA